ncbi:hypothetical protein M2360_001047 [Rhizobium sp. SG_E_25_P2]|nr:hypothetical protein [Rhizobium sp. SG_E_25_P2]
MSMIKLHAPAGPPDAAHETMPERKVKIRLSQGD